MQRFFLIFVTLAACTTASALQAGELVRRPAHCPIPYMIT